MQSAIAWLDRHPVLPTIPMLCWPAVWNGYPIVFADTGTYLSQAVHLYAGWDRPVFYSLFMLPLHATITLWPVIVAQALITSWILWLVCRVLTPRITAAGFVGGIAALSVCTWLPWIVSELMPDLFTPLLVLAICLLAWAPERLSRPEAIALVALAAFMIASQQSSVPLACVLLPVLWFFRRRRGAIVLDEAPRHGLSVAIRRGVFVCAPLAVAIAALCSANLAAHGRFALAPFGKVFLLARVIYDGPGMAVLRRDCPAAEWRLCPFIDSFPSSSDEFLWQPDSPLNRAGGPKVVSQDAADIIATALLSDPAGEIRAVVANLVEQLGRFASGDGLNPWPVQVSPWIERDFPASERATYAAARQQAGSLSVPSLLAGLHRVVAIGGVVACALLLPIALVRRRPSAGFLLIVLVALPVGAAITGGLSAPHDRYQSRLMWLPPFIAAVSLPTLRRRMA